MYPRSIATASDRKNLAAGLHPIGPRDACPPEIRSLRTYPEWRVRSQPGAVKVANSHHGLVPSARPETSLPIRPNPVAMGHGQVFGPPVAEAGAVRIRAMRAGRVHEEIAMKVYESPSKELWFTS